MFSDLLKAKRLRVEDVMQHEQNIQKLMAGRVDLIAGQKLVFLRLTKTIFPESEGGLEIVGPSFYSGTLHNVISRKIQNYETIVNDLNKGFKAIRDDGTFEKILQKHGFFCK